MDESAREERRVYQREWRRRNRDKVRAINQRYWLKRAQNRLAEQAQSEAEKGE